MGLVLSCLAGGVSWALCSGAARGEGGEVYGPHGPTLWVDVQKLCNMCVMNVRKDR